MLLLFFQSRRPQHSRPRFGQLTTRIALKKIVQSASSKGLRVVQLNSKKPPEGPTAPALQPFDDQYKVSQMAELQLKPELLPMVIQGGFYLAALVSARVLLIKPLLALTNERRRRTQGAVESAKGLESKLEKLEKNYNDAHRAALTEARDMLNNQVLAGQAEASGILQTAHDKAKVQLDEVKKKIQLELEQERTKIPALAAELTDVVVAKLVKPAVVLMIGVSLLSVPAVASSGGAVDPVYGILWPYFQFLVFATALTLLARKAISKMLEERRDGLRTKLSEAREAMTLAQRKSEEYEAKLKNLEAELAALRKDYAEEGVRQRDKLIADAEQSASQLLRDTERLANQLVAETKASLRKEIFEQVVATLDQKLKGETLLAVDASLRQSALRGLQQSVTLSQSH